MIKKVLLFLCIFTQLFTAIAVSASEEEQFKILMAEYVRSSWGKADANMEDKTGFFKSHNSAQKLINEEIPAAQKELDRIRGALNDTDKKFSEVSEGISKSRKRIKELSQELEALAGTKKLEEGMKLYNKREAVREQLERQKRTLENLGHASEGYKQDLDKKAEEVSRLNKRYENFGTLANEFNEKLYKAGNGSGSRALAREARRILNGMQEIGVLNRFIFTKSEILKNKYHLLDSQIQMLNQEVQEKIHSSLFGKATRQLIAKKTYTILQNICEFKNQCGKSEKELSEFILQSIYKENPSCAQK